MAQYLPILTMIILVMIFVAASFIASKLLTNKRPTKAKTASVRVRHRLRATSRPSGSRSASTSSR